MKINLKIELLKDTFTNSELQLSTYIEKKAEAVAQMTITELSEKTFISKTSITRFCHKLGLPGFKELKYELLQNSQKSFKDNNSKDITGLFQNDYSRLIEKMEHIIDETTIQKATKLINKSRIIYIVGIGSSGFLAQEFSSRLQRIGLISIAIVDLDYTKMTANICQKNDIFIFISLSGRTKFIIKLLEKLKARKVKTILLTEFENSIASDFATMTLLSPQKQNLSLNFYISNQFPLILLTDVLFYNIYNQNISEYDEKYKETILSLIE